MVDKSGLKSRGADIQLAPVALPQRLRGDVENAAGFRLRDALRGERLDQTALHVRRVMRGSTSGAFRVFHT
ncbi:hypothetical protein [Rhizobium ruizarguesonis]|uniref:hypothetical protein n=1 Tax=Rhizobium ruizarguesonis TaxID=2081791 RepID=UPI0013EF20B6|nr:hypothetical protein [Rhizobium ruizarguesonis]